MLVASRVQLTWLQAGSIQRVASASLSSGLLCTPHHRRSFEGHGLKRVYCCLAGIMKYMLCHF